jgi:hypothetical protein
VYRDTDDNYDKIHTQIDVMDMLPTKIDVDNERNIKLEISPPGTTSLSSHRKNETELQPPDHITPLFTKLLKLKKKINCMIGEAHTRVGVGINSGVGNSDSSDSGKRNFTEKGNNIALEEEEIVDLALEAIGIGISGVDQPRVLGQLLSCYLQAIDLLYVLLDGTDPQCFGWKPESDDDITTSNTNARHNSIGMVYVNDYDEQAEEANRRVCDCIVSALAANPAVYNMIYDPKEPIHFTELGVLFAPLRTCMQHRNRMIAVSSSIDALGEALSNVRVLPSLLHAFKTPDHRAGRSGFGILSRNDDDDDDDEGIDSEDYEEYGHLQLVGASETGASANGVMGEWSLCSRVIRMYEWLVYSIASNTGTTSRVFSSDQTSINVADLVTIAKKKNKDNPINKTLGIRILYCLRSLTASSLFPQHYV